MNQDWILTSFCFPLCSPPSALVCNVSIKKKIFSNSFQNPLLTSDPGRCFRVSMFYSYFICFRYFRINLGKHCSVFFTFELIYQYSCLSLLGSFKLSICNTKINWKLIGNPLTSLIWDKVSSMPKIIFLEKRTNKSYHSVD